ncbi:SusC/RagA family TonB-linked outer membrane protein [Pedobacter sp. ASV28]|uniref:SusC/RagA family TonB-linked outer membrane protein n=1 Tax=Pedobacter sp. ASV28 TaxID=2795123 RepID=UPI0018ED1558|nr:SusC/RagA family TonB-linked outer membrane protein [Pedobacter sp. ASV28]
MSKNYIRKMQFTRWLLPLFFPFILLHQVQAHQGIVTAQQSKGEKLELVLNKLKKKYNKTFVFDAFAVNINKIVEINDTGRLEDILNQLAAEGIGYKIVGDRVILNKIEEKKSVFKQHVVTGRVLSDNGGMVDGTPGVSVREKGTQNYTVTSEKGDFKITVKDNAILVFAMMGFKTTEVLVGEKNNITVTLEAEISNLSEVVVNGYQNIERKLYTGAATNIKGSEVKQEGITDISRMLEGKVPGLSIQNVSGTYGSAPKIRVRGVTSISGENKPLWVIDGIILEDIVNVTNDQLASGNALTLLGSSVAGINTEDIESITILQDASATALYGARAMNGVIVVKTKKGKVGKPSISINSNFSTYLKPNYDSFDMLNSREQMTIYQNMYDKYYLDYGSSVNRRIGGVFTKMAKLISTPDANGNFALENTPEGRAAFLQRYAQANTDWFDVLFRNSLLQQHNIVLQSGTENATNYLSLGFTKDSGWTIGDNYKLYNANNRSTFNLSNKISVDVTVNGSLRRQRSPGTVNRITNLVLGAYSRSFDINPFSYALSTSRTITPYDENGNLEFFTKDYAPFNILHELENNFIDINLLDVSTRGELTYKISKAFEYKVLGAARYVKTVREHQIRDNANAAEAYRADYNGTIRGANPLLYRDPDNPEEVEKSTVLPQGGLYNRTDDYLVNYNARHQVNFNKTFSNRHIVNVILGQEIKYTDRKNSYSNGYGYQYDKGGIPFIDYRLIKKNLESNDYYYGMSIDLDRYVAFYSSLTYSYKGKYIFNGSGRYDGSNRMGASKTARWLPTWTASAAWNVDEEDFMKRISSIDFLKLRASYGLTASIGNARNSVVRLGYTNVPRRYADVESSIFIAGLENSELTWEKQHEANVGFDMGLFKNKLTLTLDFYNRNSFDLISSVQTSGIGGESSKQANYADLKSHGVAAAIGTEVLKHNNLNWSLNVSFAYNTNKIVNMQYRPRIIDLVRPEGGPQNGYPVNGLYSIVFNGLNHETGLPYFVGTDGNTTLNVNPQSLTTAYLKYEGNAEPTITGGLSNSFTYKNFSLAFLISYQAGNKIRLNSAYSQGYNDFSAMPREFLNSWQMPGDERYTNVPVIVDDRLANTISGYPYSSYNYADIRTVRGDFVRLKNISLQYRLSEKVAKNLGVKSLSLGLNSTNLWLIYADKRLNGQDPEFYNSGGVASPLAKQFTFSFKVSI